MTVHAAKGLEFPVIFLVNIGKGAGGSRPPIRLVADAGGGLPSVSIGDYLSDADADAVGSRARRDQASSLRRDHPGAGSPLPLGCRAGERFHRARGSLADVLPESLTDLLTKAGSDAGQDILEWTVDTGGHRLKVCRAVTPVRAVHVRSWMRPVIGSDFGPIADEADVRLSASARLIGGRPRQRGGPVVWSTRSARLVGTLVHRMFEHAGTLADGKPCGAGGPAVLARASAGACRDAQISDEVMPEALARFDAIARRPVVARLLASGRTVARGALRLAPAGRTRHGTIDTLVIQDGVVTVVEIKTGRRAPEHERQLDAVPRSGSAAVPLPMRVDGVLVYPDDELWLSSP